MERDEPAAGDGHECPEVTSPSEGSGDAPYFPRVGEIAAALERRYGNPRHGNKSDPLDELIYIILSTRTQDAVFQANYFRLKAAYPKWDAVTAADLERVAAILAPGG